MEILTVESKKNERYLHIPVPEFDLSRASKKDMRELVKRMRRIMHGANGVGLSANQIGLNIRLFVAEIPHTKSGQKFYAIFNPKITKSSQERVTIDEGCLSVPGKYGNVARFDRITLQGFDMQGKKILIKAWGLLARVFQHETDHLDGILFIDKAKNLRKYEK